MLLLQSALHPNIGGIASTDDAKARFDAAAFVSSCADACSGFLDTCILSAQAHPSNQTNTDESEWLCGRVVTCATSLASYAAAFPDLPALSSMIAERLLPTLSCLCEKEHTLSHGGEGLPGRQVALTGTYGVKVTKRSQLRPQRSSPLYAESNRMKLTRRRKWERRRRRPRHHHHHRHQLK